MNLSCLSCKKKLDNKIQFQKIKQRRANAIEEAIPFGNSPEEIKIMPNHFFIPDKDLYCNNCLNKISKIENEVDKLLIKSSKKKSEINNLLDNYSLYFWNHANISDKDKEKFIFLFSYIEECFKLCSEITVELNYLFTRFQEHIVPNFTDFSYMFYYRNVVLKSISLIEKLTVLYSVIFKVQFRDNKTQNKYDVLLKKLRKVTDFKNTKFYEVMTNFRGTGQASLLENQRKILDHDISYSNGAEMMGVLDKINIIQSLISNYYDLFDELIQLSRDSYQSVVLPNDYSIIEFSKSSTIPVQSISPKETAFFARKFADISKQFTTDFSLNLEGSAIQNKEFQRIYDIVNRLHEISRTNTLVNNLITQAINTDQNVADILIGDLVEINYNVLINSMIYRIYSVNDKIARFLVQKYNLSTDNDYVYFDDFKSILIDNKNQSIVANNEILFTAIDSFLSSSEYTFLTNNRNRIFHIRNDQNNFNSSDEEYFNCLRLHNIQIYYKYIYKIICLIIDDINF